MTPSAPGLIRDLNAGTREIAGAVPATAHRVGSPTQARTPEHTREFSEVLRQQRSSVREPERKSEGRDGSQAVVISDGGASKPAATKARTPDRSAQEPSDAAQESDHPGAVSADAPEPENEAPRAGAEDYQDQPTKQEAGSKAPATESATAPASPQAGAVAVEAGQIAPVAAAPQESTPAQPSKQPAAQPDPSSDAAATAPKSNDSAAQQPGAGESVKGTVDAAASLPPKVAAPQVPNAQAGADRNVQAPVEPPQVAEAPPAASVKASQSAAATATSTPTDPEAAPKTQAPRHGFDAPRAEPERKPAQTQGSRDGGESRQSSPAPARSVFVVDSVAAEHAARPAAVVAPVPVKAESASAQTPAPAATSAAQGDSQVVATREGGASQGQEDSSDAGERREAPPQRDRSTPANESGVQRDTAPTIGAELGVKPGPTISGASASAARPEAQSAPTEAQVVAQSVARGLSAAVNQRGGSVTLRLVPESLGLVRIHMTLDQGAVSVRLEATNSAAQGLLTEHIAMLRGSLESRGLTVDKLSVQYAPASSAAGVGLSHGNGGAGQNSAGANQQQASQSADQQHSWQDAAGEESRGRRDAEQERSSGHASSGPEEGEAGAARGGPFPERFGGRLRLRLETVA